MTSTVNRIRTTNRTGGGGGGGDIIIVAPGDRDIGYDQFVYLQDKITANFNFDDLFYSTDFLQLFDISFDDTVDYSDEIQSVSIDQLDEVLLGETEFYQTINGLEPSVVDVGDFLAPTIFFQDSVDTDDVISSHVITLFDSVYMNDTETNISIDQFDEVFLGDPGIDVTNTFSDSVDTDDVISGHTIDQSDSVFVEDSFDSTISADYQESVYESDLLDRVSVTYPEEQDTNDQLRADFITTQFASSASSTGSVQNANNATGPNDGSNATVNATGLGGTQTGVLTLDYNTIDWFDNTITEQNHSFDIWASVNPGLTGTTSMTIDYSLDDGSTWTNLDTITATSLSGSTTLNGDTYQTPNEVATINEYNQLLVRFTMSATGVGGDCAVDACSTYFRTADVPDQGTSVVIAFA